MANWHTLANQVRQLYRKTFPIPCLLCGSPTVEMALCNACRGGLPRLTKACMRCALPLHNAQICGHCLHDPPPQQRSVSLYQYGGAVRQCITAFKFRQRIYLADLFACEMLQYIEVSQRPDCIVPIPLHPRRLRMRGYNQSLLIARALGRELSIPVRTDILFRIRHTSSQSTLNAKQRRKNMRRAFACSLADMPQHIVLIDDVMTSGATCAEASLTLLKQGAKNVEVWTIARRIGNY